MADGCFGAVVLIWRRWPPFLLSLPCFLSRMVASSVNVLKSESRPDELVGYVLCTALSRSPPDFFFTSACRGWMKSFFLSLLPSARSIFKPFVFSDSCTPVLGVVSPQFGPGDPVRKQPRFQSQVDRRHELYKCHQVALSIMETHPVSLIHSFKWIYTWVVLTLSLTVVSKQRHD